MAPEQLFDQVTKNSLENLKNNLKVQTEIRQMFEENPAFWIVLRWLCYLC